MGGDGHDSYRIMMKFPKGSEFEGIHTKENENRRQDLVLRVCSRFLFFAIRLMLCLLSDKRNRHHYRIGKGGAGHLGIGTVDGIYSLA